MCVCVRVHACHSAGWWGIGWSGGSIWFQLMHGINQNSHHYMKNCLYLTNRGIPSQGWNFLIKLPSMKISWKGKLCVCVFACALSCLSAQLSVWCWDWFHLPQQNIWGLDQPPSFFYSCHTHISKDVTLYMTNNENQIRQYHKCGFPSALRVWLW